MITTLEKSELKTTNQIIPKYLIREEIDGKSFFFKGYQSVINKSKKLEDIIGISGLQSFIIYLFSSYSHLNISRKHYHFFNNIGMNLSKETTLILDFSIFDKTVLTFDKIDEHYVKVPPKVVVEVDVKIENENQTDFDYITQKTEKLLDFGTERIIWILSKNKKIIVAEKKARWQIINWNEDFELIDGLIINLQKMFEEEGFIGSE